MGKDDKGNDKQFQRLNKPVYYKKLDEEGKPVTQDDKKLKPNEFKFYDIINQPIYIRTINSIPSIEDNEYIPVSPPLHILRPTIKPSNYRNSNIDEDFLFNKIIQPIYIAKKDLDHFRNKIGGKLNDNKLINYAKIDEPVYFKKITIKKKTLSKKPKKSEEKEEIIYERLGKPIYKKIQEKTQNKNEEMEDDREDREFRQINKPLFSKDEKEEKYKDLQPPLYVRKEDLEVLNEMLGGDDKQLKKFKRIDKQVYHKRAYSLALPYAYNSLIAGEDEFEKYKIINKPLYERIEDGNDIEKDDEEKRFQVVGRPLFFRTESSTILRPEEDEDSQFEVSSKRIYVKNKDFDGLFADMGGKEKFKKYIKVIRPLYIKETNQFKESDNEIDTSKKKPKKIFKLIYEPYYIKRVLPSEETDEKTQFDDEDSHFTPVNIKVYYSNKIKPNIYDRRNFERVGLPLYRKIYGDDDGEFIRYVLIQVPIYVKNMEGDGYEVIKKRFYIRRDDLNGKQIPFGEDEEDENFNEYILEKLYVRDNDISENISYYIKDPFGEEEEGYKIIKIAIYIKKNDEEDEKLFAVDDNLKRIDIRNIKNKNMNYLSKPNIKEEDKKFLSSYLDKMRTGSTFKPLTVRRVLYRVIKEKKKKK
jgi:hypothetical protein